ncbi:MAG: pilus assembly protein [Acidobacteria bacterium]|nr:pilus assembly protein [Acidobacteriota bacterium]
MIRPVTRARRRRQGGNALIEFALAFGFLFPAITGTFQFGYAFFVYNELQNAVREGARYAAFKTYDSASSTPTTTFSNSVKNAVVYGSPTGGQTPIVPSLTTENVSFTVTFTNGVPKTMTVSIQNYTLDAFLRTFTLNKPSASFAYVGVYAPPA